MDADTTGNIHKMISKLKLHIGECIKTDNIILTDLFVCIDALRTIQHFFRHVRTFPCIPRLNQYQAADKLFYPRTQRSASGESRTSNHSIPSLTLY